MANSIRILAGTTVRQQPNVLAAYLRQLQAQELPAGVEVDYCFVDDNDDAASSALLEGFRTVMLPSSVATSYEIAADTHRWDEGGFERVARNKQALLNIALEEGYDYFWSVDSDLLMEPQTLRSLMHCAVPVVSAIFWTQWQNGGEHQPQCWLRHPYGLSGLGMEAHQYMDKLVNHQFVRVAGGGACCLIHREVLEAGVGYHPRLEGLPNEGMWQGEDRSFAIRLAQKHLWQYADAWPLVFHAYHHAERTDEALQEVLEVLNTPRQAHVTWGDWVSFIVEPLQDTALADNVEPTNRSFRGRMGGMKLLPSLEEALMDMTPGEDRVVELRFPSWYEVKALAGKTRMYRVRLLDVRSRNSG